jgi:S1-C subfamily serine protease
MKAFGITPEEYEKNRLGLLRAVRTSSWFFVVVLLLPFVVGLLYQFGILNSASPFSDDIQQPVAKVITPQGVGTAFLVSPTKLLTAGHVVNGLKVGDNVELVFERLETPQTIQAKILYIAPNTVQVKPDGSVPFEYFLNDFSVLELATPSEIPPLFLGESDAVNLLDEVILIGYPSADFSISKGNLNNDSFNGLNLFKLDATSNPGNSGGPCILKIDNTVIGVLVGGQQNSQGQNIAIKIADIQTKLKAAGIDITN